MPFYDYNCRKCGHTQEEFHSVTVCDNHTFACPSCKVKLERLIPATQGKPVCFTFESEIAGTTWTGPRQRAEWLKKNNWVEVPRLKDRKDWKGREERECENRQQRQLRDGAYLRDRSKVRVDRSLPDPAPKNAVKGATLQ